MPLHRGHIDDHAIGPVQREGPHIDGIRQFHDKTRAIRVLADARAHDDGFFGGSNRRNRRRGKIWGRCCGIGSLSEDFGDHIVDGFGFGDWLGRVLGSGNAHEQANHYTKSDIPQLTHRTGPSLPLGNRGSGINHLRFVSTFCF